MRRLSDWAVGPLADGSLASVMAAKVSYKSDTLETPSNACCTSGYDAPATHAAACRNPPLGLPQSRHPGRSTRDSLHRRRPGCSRSRRIRQFEASVEGKTTQVGSQGQLSVGRITDGRGFADHGRRALISGSVMAGWMRPSLAAALICWAEKSVRATSVRRTIRQSDVRVCSSSKKWRRRPMLARLAASRGLMLARARIRTYWVSLSWRRASLRRDPCSTRARPASVGVLVK